ncbi:ATP-binding protein [Methanobrevibacter sp.]|uniref:ATP-binding protein n=1 Tax=Methanobrevibacter sp. TaxID=66852 RepID=UPI0038904526
MHIEKQFRELVNIEEVRAYNISNIDLFEVVPQYQKPIKIPFCNIIKYVQSDVNMFIPIDDGKDFIINRLGSNILQRGNIKLKDVEDGIEFISTVEPDITLSIEIITPLLLVVDELTMNAIKHAFPEDWPNKTITKEIKRLDENTGELIIKDNGIGIDKTKKDMKHSLGCEIIKNLTKQLDGNISYLDVDKGTGFRLLFPLTMEHTISQ